MTDLSQLSDEQLMQIAGIKPDLSQVSDEELMRIAGVDQNPNLFQRIGQDYQRRVGDAQGMADSFVNGQAGAEVGPEMMLKIAGIGPEAMAETVSSLTPGFVKKGIGAAANLAGKLPSFSGRTIGEDIPQESANLAQKFQQFKTNNPRTGNAIGAAGDTLGLLAMAGGAQAAEGALGIAGKGARGTLDILNPPIPTADMIKKEAGKAYQAAEVNGGTLHPSVRNEFIDEVNKLAPQTEDEKLLAGNSDFTKAVEALNMRRDAPLTLEQAQGIDEQLGDLVDSNLHPNGSPTKVGRRILEIQDTLRDFTRNVDPERVEGGTEGFKAWQEGQRLWSKQAKMRDIEKIIQRADMTDNPATAIKTGFRNLALNGKRMRGYSAKERLLITNAAKSGVVSDTLRTLGSRLNPIAAMATHGPVGGLAAGMVSSGSRKAATVMQANKAIKVARAIGRDYKFNPDDLND